MHTGVGATGDGQRNRTAEDRRERLLERALDAAQPRLGGPAGEPGPVVFEIEPGGQTSSRKTISVESERRGPSFRMRV